MPVSNEEKEYVAYTVELMRSLGQVSAKRMFGGHGVFLNKLMFALIANDVLYFKADQETIPFYAKRQLEAFSYAKKGKTFWLCYYQAPEEALENEQDMALWAHQAYAVALRAQAKKLKS